MEKLTFKKTEAVKAKISIFISCYESRYKTAESYIFHYAIKRLVGLFLPGKCQFQEKTKQGNTIFVQLVRPAYNSKFCLAF